MRIQYGVELTLYGGSARLHRTEPLRSRFNTPLFPATTTLDIRNQTPDGSVVWCSVLYLYLRALNSMILISKSRLFILPLASHDSFISQLHYYIVTLLSLAVVSYWLSFLASCPCFQASRADSCLVWSAQVCSGLPTFCSPRQFSCSLL